MKKLTLILAMSSIVAYGQVDTSKQPIFGSKVITVHLGKYHEDELNLPSKCLIRTQTFLATFCMKGNKKWYSIELNKRIGWWRDCNVGVYKDHVIFLSFTDDFTNEQFNELLNLIKKCKENLK